MKVKVEIVRVVRKLGTDLLILVEKIAHNILTNLRLDVYNTSRRKEANLLKREEMMEIYKFEA